LLFLVGYAFSRQFGVTRSVALLSAWWLVVLVTPFVPHPFFYNILSVAPHTALIVLYPAVILILLVGVGRSGANIDIARGMVLMGLLWYILCAAPTVIAIAAPGFLAYAVTACFLARTKEELRRKLLVIVAVAVSAVILFWPLYLWSLFSYTAPYFFPQEFVIDFRHQVSDISILFDRGSFGWGGPAAVILAIAGALLSLRRCEMERRAAAWLLLLIVGGVLGIALIVPGLPPQTILPTIKYFEMAAWPLYAMFGATLASMIAAQIARLGPRVLHKLASDWLVIVPSITMALALPLINLPQPDYLSLPPGTTNVVDRLRREIGFESNAEFRGRVATIVPTAIPADSSRPEQDPVMQQIFAALALSKSTGNDHMAPGLWFFQIPTLFEYNLLISPAFHLLAKRALYTPAIPHLRNNLLVNVTNEPILKLLGVRFVLLADPTPPAQALPEIGQLRETITVGKQRWRLFELDRPNLASYSPTMLEVRQTMDAMLHVVASPDTDLTRQGVLQSEIADPLVAADETGLSLSGGDLRLIAHSRGRSLVVVPLEYSHCIEMQYVNSTGPATLLRVDGLLTGVLFDREIDALLRFRIGPLSNPLCRYRDRSDLRSLQ
jgi:hypothetical protein